MERNRKAVSTHDLYVTGTDKARQLITFDNWSIFSRLLSKNHGADSEVLLFQQAIYTPGSTLPNYTMPLTSPSFDFITCLTITASFSIPDLRKLSSMRNLGYLVLVDTRANLADEPEFYASVINDGLIRAWAESAVSSERAFPVLRALRFVRCLYLTERCIIYLNRFSSLGLVEFQGFEFDSLAATDTFYEQGWDQTPLSVPGIDNTTTEASIKLSKAGELEHSKKPQMNDKTSSTTFRISSEKFPFLSQFLDIGEYRRNEDLKEAGLQFGPNTAFGLRHPMIPTAVIHLGPPDDIKLHKCIAFYRGDFGRARAQLESHRNKDRVQKAPKRAAPGVLRPGKKQALGNMMDMFL